MAFKKRKFFGEKFPIDFSYSGYHFVVDLVRVDGEIIPHRNFLWGISFLFGIFVVYLCCALVHCYELWKQNYPKSYPN